MLAFMTAAGRVLAGSLTEVQTVFLVMMENEDWRAIAGKTNCPYINQTLLPQASYCDQYYSPPFLHPSEPNYLWLVAGTNFGVTNNAPPATNSQNTVNHLAYLLDKAGVSWKSYQAGITGVDCPTNYGDYEIDPFLFFQSVTSNANYCRTHIRPYSELDTDLTNRNVARFNFICPGLCNMMHAPCGVAEGDSWLASEIPRIMASPAYTNNGAIIITWDEGFDEPVPYPIGMIVLSPLAKGGGYHNGLLYTHSSTLRTLQDIFQVRPYLGDAANAANLSDLFAPLKLFSPKLLPNGVFSFTVSNTTLGKTSYVQLNTLLTTTNWMTVSTNVPLTNSFLFQSAPTNLPQRYYRVRQAP